MTEINCDVFKCKYNDSETKNVIGKCTRKTILYRPLSAMLNGTEYETTGCRCFEVKKGIKND